VDISIAAASPRTQALFLLSLARNFYPPQHDRIVTQLGSIEALLDAPEDELRRLELTGGQLQRLIDVRSSTDPARALERLAAQDIKVVGYGDEGYPELLAPLSDAPLLLYCKGDPQLMRSHGVAIVGSRKCSETGIRLAREFGRDLAEVGIPVVSGLALGIDGAAHTGALDAGGPTVAVLGCGVDTVYPPEHHELYARLCERALVVSEYPPGTEPRKEHFPQRNRIISGLSRGVLVVEAALGSGALITARQALEQGREVFAVPGPVTSPFTKGTHHLIKTGNAKLVENVNDILVEFGTNKAALLKERYGSRAGASPEKSPGSDTGSPSRKENNTAGHASLGQEADGISTSTLTGEGAGSTNKLAPAEQAVLEALSYEGTHINDVVRKLSISTPECIAQLTMLEIRGLICASSGGYYVRL
jgi:DNA processing protein